jgi:hypothetical protein
MMTIVGVDLGLGLEGVVGTCGRGLRCLRVERLLGR